METWQKGIAVAGNAGGASGVITGLAAVGIDPAHFNLQAGLHSTLAIAGGQPAHVRDYRRAGVSEAVAATE